MNPFSYARVYLSIDPGFLQVEMGFFFLILERSELRKKFYERYEIVPEF